MSQIFYEFMIKASVYINHILKKIGIIIIMLCQYNGSGLQYNLIFSSFLKIYSVMCLDSYINNVEINKERKNIKKNIWKERIFIVYVVN